MTCPRCGLPDLGEPRDAPDDVCSPFTSPDCWWVRSLGVPGPVRPVPRPNPAHGLSSPRTRPGTQ